MIPLLRDGGRLFGAATFVVALPLSAAGFAHSSGRPWHSAVHLATSMGALVVALWIVRATLSRVWAPDTSPARVALRLLWSFALMAVAALNLSELQTMPATLWVASLCLGLAVVSMIHVGWPARLLAQLWIPEKIPYAASMAARARGWRAQLAPRAERRYAEPVHAGGVPRPMAAATRGPRPAPTFEKIRAEMDEVTYTAGRPNVLTMTKIVPVDGEDAHGDLRGGDSEATAAAQLSRREARGDFRRIDRDGETVLACAGILDVVTVCALQPLIEAVVAERRPTIVLDAGALRRIDSTGVGAILGLIKRARSFGGAVRISGLRDQPLEVFRMLRLDLILELPGGSKPHGSS